MKPDTVGPVLSQTMALVLDDCILLLEMSIAYARSASTARNGLFSLNLWSTQHPHAQAVYCALNLSIDMLSA